MNTIKHIARFIFIVLFITACKKQDTTTTNNTNNPTNPTNPTDPTDPVTHDSVRVLKSIGTLNGQGDDFTFEYDNNNNLVKFYMAYTWAHTAPCYVLYQDGKPFVIISEYKDINGSIQKTSMILQYGANSKMSRVYYKTYRYGLANTDPYFSDLNDGYVYHDYDSLVYTATDQLESIYRMEVSNGIPAPYRKIKYTYPSASDTVANLLSEYNIDSNGNPVWIQELLITTNTMDNPACKLLPYFPFVFTLTYINDNSIVMKLPLLYDNSFTNLDLFLPLVPKCVTHYEAYTTTAGANNTNDPFQYIYSSDSLQLVTDNQIIPARKVYYNFAKVQR